jgi:hypothetical protein
LLVLEAEQPALLELMETFLIQVEHHVVLEAIHLLGKHLEHHAQLDMSVLLDHLVELNVQLEHIRKFYIIFIEMHHNQVVFHVLGELTLPSDHLLEHHVAEETSALDHLEADRLVQEEPTAMPLMKIEYSMISRNIRCCWVHILNTMRIRIH